jgi:hypothetical protein
MKASPVEHITAESGRGQDGSCANYDKLNSEKIRWWGAGNGSYTIEPVACE